MCLGNTVDDLACGVLYAHPALTEVVAQALGPPLDAMSDRPRSHRESGRAGTRDALNLDPSPLQTDQTGMFGIPEGPMFRGRERSLGRLAETFCLTPVREVSNSTS